MKSLERLKIAFIVHDYNRHIGHSRYVAELASRFRRTHEVHVFTNKIDDNDTTAIHFHHVPAWRPNALASILSFVIPATLKVRGQFDVIHAQGLCGLRHNVVTAHFCQPAWYRALKQQGLQLTISQKIYKHLVAQLEKRAICQPTTRRVIAISKLVKSNLLEHYGRSTNVDVIYHGTDSVTFHPDNRNRFRVAVRRDIGIDDDKFVALYVGDLKKGAIAAIRATAKAPGVTLLLLSGSNKTDFESLAIREKVSDRIIFHPHSKNVEKFFAMADAFVFPTVYDPFGMVITEAMATGLPVITSKSAGASELITDGLNGFLTDNPWDAESIALRLEMLRDDTQLREKIGNSARSRIEPFTWEQTAEQTLQTYQQYLKSES